MAIEGCWKRRVAWMGVVLAGVSGGVTLSRADSIRTRAKMADHMCAVEQKEVAALARAMDELSVYQLLVALYENFVKARASNESARRHRTVPAAPESRQPRAVRPGPARDRILERMHRIESGG